MIGSENMPEQQPPDSTAGQTAPPPPGSTHSEAQEVKKKRGGRPRIEETRKHDHRLTIAVDGAEWMTWRECARLAKSSVSSWVRETVNGSLSAIGTTKVRASISDDVRAAKQELNRLGTNVNQIARALNAEVQGGPVVDRSAVTEELSAVREQLAALRQQLIVVDEQARPRTLLTDFRDRLDELVAEAAEESP